LPPRRGEGRKPVRDALGIRPPPPLRGGGRDPEFRRSPAPPGPAPEGASPPGLRPPPVRGGGANPGGKRPLGQDPGGQGSVGIRDRAPPPVGGGGGEFLAHPSRVCVPPPYGGANYATSGDMGQETREGYLKRKLLN